MISLARKEAQRFEAQLTEAQRSAREQVSSGEFNNRSSIDVDGWGTSGAVGTEEGGSGNKGKEKAPLEGDDGVAVEALESKMQQKRKSSESGRGARTYDSGEGDAIFDADAPDDLKVVDEAIEAARQNAQSAMQSLQSFWGKVQADERLSRVQASVADALQSISLPKGSESSQTNPTDSQSPKTREYVLPDLTKQFQINFPHLDIRESQAMARRYFEASQHAARDWGKEMSKEMSNLMGDLVKIVPPEEQTGSHQQAQPSEKSQMTVSETAKGKRI